MSPSASSDLLADFRQAVKGEPDDVHCEYPLRSRRFRAVPVLLVLGIAAVSTEASDSAVEYSRDFASEGPDNLSLAPFGKGATSLLKQTGDGILISMPPGHEVNSVGIAPRFQVRGDFEIRVRYEVKTWSRAEKGAGIGPAIYITTENSTAAELGRMHGPEDKDAHTTFAAVVVEGERTKAARSFATTATKGQLCLRRVGTSLSFETREDWVDGPFDVLKTADFTSDDLSLVRVALKRSDPNASARVLLGDLRIRADELPHLPSEQARSERLYRPSYHPPPRASSWTTLALLGGSIAVVLTGGGIWLVRRWKR